MPTHSSDEILLPAIFSFNRWCAIMLSTATLTFLIGALLALLGMGLGAVALAPILFFIGVLAGGNSAGGRLLGLALGTVVLLFIVVRILIIVFNKWRNNQVSTLRLLTSQEIAERRRQGLVVSVAVKQPYQPAFANASAIAIGLILGVSVFASLVFFVRQFAF